MEFVAPENFRPIRLGIVGAGAIVRTAHLPAALRSPLVELTAVVDTNRDNAARLAEEFALHCAVVPTVAQIVDRVDAIIIATPPGSHYAIAETALTHNLHVLVEKPMTTRQAEAAHLCELAEAKGKVLAVGYYSRCYPSIVLMKRLIEQGYLGEIRSFRFEHGSVGGWTPVSNYKLNQRESGGGELMSNGTYFIDRLLYWFGAPTTFSYFDDSHGGPEANCRCQMQFDNAIGRFSGELFLSATVGKKTRFVLHTTKYSCEHLESQTQSITLYPNDTKGMRMEVFPDAVADSAQHDYFQEQLERFAGAINGWCTVPVDGRFGAKSVELIEKMYRNRRQLDEPWLSHLKKSQLEESFVQS